MRLWPNRILRWFLVCGTIAAAVGFWPGTSSATYDPDSDGNPNAAASASSANTDPRVDDLPLGAPKAQKAAGRYAAGRILVKYKNTVTQSASLNSLNQKYSVKKISPLLQRKSAQQTEVARVMARFPNRTKRIPLGAAVPDLSNLYVLELSAGANVEQAVQAFANDPLVEYAQPDYVMQAARLPNDTYADPDQNGSWSMGAWGQPIISGISDLWALKTISVESAWNQTKGEGIVVAVVDTGLDYTHPDIAQNVWVNAGEIANNYIDDDNNGYVDDVRGWDFTSCKVFTSTGCDPKSPDNDPRDGEGHGTHVSGTIAAVGDNGIGMVGVAPKARILPVKGLSDDGGGYSSELAMGLVYAAQNGADVINNSWGCGYCPSNPVVEDAVRTAMGLGSVVVFAAGNGGGGSPVQDHSPQNMPEVITVGSSTYGDHVSYFSSYGADLMAPGSGSENNDRGYPWASFRTILSLRAAGTGADADPKLLVGTQYRLNAGTSMAAPHVSGVAALILSKHPEFTNDQIELVLRASADNITADFLEASAGAGRLNAARALAITSVPRIKITSPVHQATFLPETPSVAITGSAGGPGFKSFDLYYGRGRKPSAWIWIAGPSTAAVENGLLANWNTAALPVGAYTLRLVVTTTDAKTFEFNRRVFIERVVSRATAPSIAPQLDPRVSGNWLVWEDGRPSTATGENYGVFYRNLATGEEKQVPNTSDGLNVYPRIADGRILWHNYQNSYFPYSSIETYEIATGRQSLVDPARTTDYQLGDITPKLIAWVATKWFPADGEDVAGVFIKDIQTEQVRRIAGGLKDPRIIRVPVASDDYVVWEYLPDPFNGDRSNLALYNLKTNTESTIVQHTRNASVPVIYGNKIVWQDNRNGNWDIYLYDIPTKVQTRITTNTADQLQPRISRDFIVWQDNRDGRAAITAYHLATGQELGITAHEGNQWAADVDEGLIVWADDRVGTRLYRYEMPVITAIEPARMTVGGVVTLRGRHFTVAGNNVNFGKTLGVVKGLASSDGQSLQFTVPSTALGTYVLSVSNANGISTTMPLAVVRPADLAVQAIKFYRKGALETPGNEVVPVIGQPVTAKAVLGNIGELDSGSFTVKWYLDNTEAASATHPNLSYGVSSDDKAVRFAWTATAGSHTFKVTADPENAVKEIVETNNTLSRAVNVLKPSDLIFTAITASPLWVGGQTALSISNTVKNAAAAGSAASPATTVQYYLKSVQNPGSGDRSLAISRSVPALAPTGASAGTVSLKILSDIPMGAYYVCSKVDSADTVFESNEANNAICTAIPIQVSLPELGLGNAVSTTTGLTGTVGAGGSIAVYEAEYNSGEVLAGAYTLSFALRPFRTPQVIPLAATRSIASLAPRVTSQVVVTLTIPASTPGGRYDVCAISDSGNTVPELYEGNNTNCTNYQTSVYVTKPDLTVTVTLISTTGIGTGTPLSIWDTVKNIGPAGSAIPTNFKVAYYLTKQKDIVGPGDILLQTARTIASLPVGASSSAKTDSVVTTTTPAGTYWVCARVDEKLTIEEGNEANNVGCYPTPLNVN